MARQRMDIKQAAQALNITTDAVHKRVKRGTLEAEKDAEGRVYVYLDDVWTLDIRDELIDRLENEIEYLRREAEDRKEEARRKDAILLTMAQRIPELEAAEIPIESSIPATPDTGKGAGSNDPEKPPWWRRIFQ
jgi:hypothetical protein